MKVLAVAGGVGGAKLADGLAMALPAGALTIVVNTGDDFEHLGLKICPDLDTVCYTLAGIASPETGWGRAAETWNALESLAELGGPAWFRLGDRDLGTHLERTRLIRAGYTLSQVTGRFCQAWGIRQTILPMSDQAVATWVETDEGELLFQEYFVRRGCQPKVKSFRFQNIEDAQPAPGILEAIQEAQVIIICPSNPWVSIDPILAVPGIQSELSERAHAGYPILAVSPIVKGTAIKGPAAKMYTELGIRPTALAVAHHYGVKATGGLLTGFIFDVADTDQIDLVTELGLQPMVTNIVMKTAQDRLRLANEILAFGKKLIQSDL